MFVHPSLELRLGDFSLLEYLLFREAIMLVCEFAAAAVSH
jgi:hypothetical protein